ncbi:MAG: hypothetical protein KZQ60_15795 [Candidatus Thiodiazotropha sp. (ex Lucinoma aequizonata)]|nr:hypothetical protein [Candidatus Thiodiazotropha sp. (ex Lucinoma aequizonata)]
MHYSIMTTAMTLRRLGCALCMPFISPFRSAFRPYKRAYAYRGLTAFAPLSMAVSERTRPSGSLSLRPFTRFGSVHSHSRLAKLMAADSNASSRLMLLSDTPSVLRSVI